MSGLTRADAPVLIGAVHLLPLPDAPGHLDRNAVWQRAAGDAQALIAGGMDGVVVENFGDAPFYGDDVPKWTVAEMTRIAVQLRSLLGPEVLLGINVLRNDALAAIAIAAASEADFVRVNVHSGVMLTDQGALTGRAAESVRLRERLRAKARIFADVGVKHALPPAGFDLAQAAEDTVLRGLADGLIVSGRATGQGVASTDLQRVRQAVPNTPLWIGSGLTAESAKQLLALADGAIVGTALKIAGQVHAEVDRRAVETLVSAVRG